MVLEYKISSDVAFGYSLHRSVGYIVYVVRKHSPILSLIECGTPIQSLIQAPTNLISRVLYVRLIWMAVLSRN